MTPVAVLRPGVAVLPTARLRPDPRAVTPALLDRLLERSQFALPMRCVAAPERHTENAIVTAAN